MDAGGLPWPGPLCCNQAMNTRFVHAACPHDCPDTCAIRVTVADGVATRVQGDPDHPPTNGSLCTKVARYTERVYHPERLLHPLKRVGAKGSGQFTRVGWNEALDDIAGRLRAIAERDPRAILPYSYAGTMGLVQGESMSARFFNRIGASELDRTICANAGATALQLTYGAKIGMHVEQFRDSRLILIWGSNSIASNLHFWPHVLAAKRADIDSPCTRPMVPAYEYGRMARGSRSAMARRRAAMSSSASFQFTRVNCPLPFGPTRFRGWSSRSGWYTRSVYRATLVQSEPLVGG